MRTEREVYWLNTLILCFVSTLITIPLLFESIKMFVIMFLMFNLGVFFMRYSMGAIIWLKCKYKGKPYYEGMWIQN